MRFNWKDSYIGNKHVLESAMLIPVFLKDHLSYLQIDTGTRSSIIYKEFILSQNIAHGQNDNIELEVRIDAVNHVIKFKVDTDSKVHYYNEKPVIGLLGLDFITKNNLFIDFPNQVIEFNKKNIAITKTKYISFPLKLMHEFIVFSTKIDSKNYNFMWDSGASFIDLFTNANLWEDFTSKSLSDDSNELINVSGAFDTEHILIKNKIDKDFKLLNHSMRGKDIYCNKIYSPLTDLSLIRIDGLIGNTLLLTKIIYFDFTLNELTMLNM